MLAADDASVSGLLTVLRISRVMERIDAGVSPQQYRMLKLIGAGGERSARLAERLAVAKPTLTSTADSLVAAGLAVREAEPGDRRVVRLRLTPAGVAAVATADQAYGEWFDGLLEQAGHRDDILTGLRAIEETMIEPLARLAHAAEADAKADAKGRGRRTSRDRHQSGRSPRLRPPPLPPRAPRRRPPRRRPPRRRPPRRRPQTARDNCDGGRGHDGT